MSFDKCACWIPRCDGAHCGDNWWEHETTEAEGPPHYMSKTQGIRLLEECWGWNITRHIDGRLTMLCAHCVQRTTGCAIGRHDWFEPELDFNAPVAERPVELCRCCRIVRRDYEPLNVPPAGHPDTMRHLCDADEAVLKRYAAQFSQEVI